MFRMDLLTPAKLEGVIFMDKKPMSLGNHTDIEGVSWDIKGIFHGEGKMFVCACKQSELHPYFYDTSGQDFGYVSQKWLPYEIREKT